MRVKVNRSEVLPSKANNDLRERDNVFEASEDCLPRSPLNDSYGNYDTELFHCGQNLEIYQNKI